MAQLILTHGSQFHRAIRTRNAFPLTLRIGKFFLFFSLTLMIGVLSFFYLVYSTEIHTKGYDLKKLNLERNKLVEARESRSTDIAKLKSLITIKESNIFATMMPVKHAIFIKKDGSIAKLPDSLGRP